MNERINDLFGQALDQAVPETWTTLNPAQLSKLKEKFAELLVKECALTIQDFVDHRFPASEYPNRLKRHFGVE
jgi:hypothetical protein